MAERQLWPVAVVHPQRDDQGGFGLSPSETEALGRDLGRLFDSWEAQGIQGALPTSGTGANGLGGDLADPVADPLADPLVGPMFGSFSDGDGDGGWV